MITIDGAFGNGTALVTWTPSRQNASSVLPASIGAYVGFAPSFSPVIPCSMFLPPATGGILYHTGWTPYGGRLNTIEIGAIVSKLGDHHYPLPCAHSTVTGTITSLGADGNFFATHRLCNTRLPNGYPYYHSNGNLASFLVGNVASKTNAKAYNHKGELVGIPIATATRALWYDNQFLLMSHVPLDATSPSYPNEHAQHAEWLWNINSPLSANNYPKAARRCSWTHVTANVWREEYWMCYNHNASYVPMLPLGYNGFPYVVAQIHVIRTHTLRYIHQDPVAYFKLIFDIVEDAEYEGESGGQPRVSGTRHCEYRNEVYGEVLAPGLCLDRSAPILELDDYCRMAAGRAALLYEEDAMGVARSNALADVSGLASNWLENFSQMGGYADVFDPLIDGYDAYKSNDIVAAAKALASAYLVYKYCIAPTASDAKDLSKNLESEIHSSLHPLFVNERRRGNHFVDLPLGDRNCLAGYYVTYHMSLKDTSFSTVLNALDRLGLDPSSVNGWDFIPFSFVLDWFVSVGPALERISAYNNARLTRELKVRVQTFKVVWPLSTIELLRYIPYNWKATEPLLYSWYDRRVAQRWGKINPFAGQTNDGLSASQMTQGAALLTAILL